MLTKPLTVMADREIKLGSHVKLRSGSPDMTVYEVGENFVTCVWFVSGERKQGEFPIAGLIVIGA